MIPKKKKGEDPGPEELGSRFVDPEQCNGGSGVIGKYLGMEKTYGIHGGENWERNVNKEFRKIKKKRKKITLTLMTIILVRSNHYL